MIIPLNYFVDRRPATGPKGHLIVSGLTSPMRNPLASVLPDNVILDYRPRDYASVFPIYDIKRFEYSISYGYTNNDFHEDFGLSKSVYSAGGYFAFTDYDYLYNSPFAVSEYGMAMLAIVKATESQEGTSYPGFLQLSQLSPTPNRIFYCRVSPTAAAFYDLGDGALHTVGTSPTWDDDLSLNKWIIMLVTMDNSAFLNFSVKGGQWSNVSTTGSLTPSNLANVQSIGIPWTKGLYTALATYAVYDATDPDPVDSMEWTVFESEHTCAEYSVTARQIYFACSGNVAWEAYYDGGWHRSSFGTGEQLVTFPQFTAIRPVLQNSGLLNADANAVINWVEVVDLAPAMLTKLGSASPSYTMAFKR